MMRGLGLAAAVLALGCASPQYQSGHLHCAKSGDACPQSFYCAGDDRCWAAGTAPDMTTMLDGAADLAPMPLADLAPPSGSDLAGTPSLCSGAGALFCDGFESGMVDGTSWTDGSSGGTVTVDSTHVFRGRFAMHAHVDMTPSGGDGEAGLLTHRALPVTGTVYVRVWAWFASPLSSEFDQFLNFVDGGGSGVSFALRDGDAVDNDYTGSGVYKPSTLSVPIDKWTCLRMSISGQSATGMTGDIHLYIDGLEASDAQALAAPITQEVGLAVGLDLFHPASIVAPQEAWFDEVIIDDKPVSCTE